VYLGWKHFKEQEQAYTLVPLVKGGGSRVVAMPLTSCKTDIYQTCKNFFFPEGNSIFGNEDNMLFSLTNFKGEKVEESIKVGREYIPFNLCNYMEAHKIRTVRLYLQSRKIDGSDDDDDLLSSAFDHDLNQEGSLIGPYLERQSLVSRSLLHQNKTIKEYQESLKADERKAASRERENEESKRKKRIQNARADRVVPEPDDEFVTVKVRHITMGLQSRKFPKTSRMAAVCDWAGSLSPDPENFTIYHLRVVQKPSEELSDRCTYLMVEEEHGTPGLLESDDEVQFWGFGTVSKNNNEPLPDLNYPEDEDVQEVDSCLDHYYAFILNDSDSTALCCEEQDSITFNGDNNEIFRDYKTTAEDVRAQPGVPKKELRELLDGLAKEIAYTSISKFNISRSFVWEGAERALTRKSFCAKNKMSVKFTDDIGNSEGAVDLGGPMKEFFTLVLQWMVTSQLFCGPEHHKYISFQSTCLEGNDYFFAGTLIAMSLVHGGAGPQCFAHNMFEALHRVPDKVAITIEDVYDRELQSSLEKLSNSGVLDLAGMLQPTQTTDDIRKIAEMTAKWFVLGRARPALESFLNGLSTLGVLDALTHNPDVFRPAFCYYPEKLTAESTENLFQVFQSPVGSNKAVTESLVLSRWHDYLQDIEEGEDSLTFNDILFFSTACKVLPARKIYPTIQFLHHPEACGEKSRFPKANTCSNILYLPVVHTTYEA
ncbi:G2 M phase-specific E3 ubiquitin- ligase-like, partial [Paramuricea clavata]